jgi:hypothetical protein
MNSYCNSLLNKISYAVDYVNEEPVEVIKTSKSYKKKKSFVADSDEEIEMEDASDDSEEDFDMPVIPRERPQRARPTVKKTTEDILQEYEDVDEEQELEFVKEMTKEKRKYISDEEEEEEDEEHQEMEDQNVVVEVDSEDSDFELSSVRYIEPAI